MKAHPDLKYNKVSAPRARSSTARLSFLARPTKLSLEMASSPIVPGKLADESQMGNLSCLLTSPPLTPTSVTVSNIGTSTFAAQPENYVARTSTSPSNTHKPTPMIPKPPKKRYLQENSYSTSHNDGNILYTASKNMKNDVISPVINSTPTWNIDEITSEKSPNNQLQASPYLYTSQTAYHQDTDIHKPSWNNKFNTCEIVTNGDVLDCSKSLLNHRTSVDVACQVVSEYINSFSGIPDVCNSGGLESSFSRVHDDEDVAMNLSNHNFETIKVSQQQIIEKAIDKFCGSDYQRIKGLKQDTFIPPIPNSFIQSVPGECNNNILASTSPQSKFIPNMPFSADSFTALIADSKVLNDTSIHQLPENKVKNVTIFPLPQTVPSMPVISYCGDNVKSVELFSHEVTANKESVTDTTIETQCVVENKSHIKNVIPPDNSYEPGRESFCNLNNIKEDGSNKDFLKKRFIKKFKSDDSHFAWNSSPPKKVNCELNSVIYGSKNDESGASITNVYSETNAASINLKLSGNFTTDINEQDSVKDSTVYKKVGSENDNCLRTDLNNCVNIISSSSTNDIKTENTCNSSGLLKNSFKSIDDEKETLQCYTRATGSSKRKISVKRAQMLKQESVTSDVKTENNATVPNVSAHVSKLSEELNSDNQTIKNEQSKMYAQKIERNVQSKQKRPRTKAPVELPAPREATIRACKGLKYREFMHGISSGRRTKKSHQNSLLIHPQTGEKSASSEVSSNSSRYSVKSATSVSDITAPTSSHGSSVNVNTKEKPTALMTISFILAAAAEESSFFGTTEEPATQQRTRLNSLESRSSERTDSAAESDDSSSLKNQSSSHSTQNIHNKRKNSSEVLPPADFEDFQIKKICSKSSEKRLSVESDSSKSSQDTPSSSPSSSSHGFPQENSSNPRVGSQKRKRLKHNVKKNASNNRDTSVVSPELLTDIALDTLATVAVAETRMHSDDETTKCCKPTTDKSQSSESLPPPL